MENVWQNGVIAVRLGDYLMGLVFFKNFSFFPKSEGFRS